MKMYGICHGLILGLLLTNIAYADVLNISVAQDATIISYSPTGNINNPNYLYTGSHSDGTRSESIFGFDMSALTSLSGITINSITFNAYNIYNNGDGYIDIALGNNDAWVDTGTTWNTDSGNHGSAIDSQLVTANDLNSYISWDISAIDSAEFTVDNYLTFYLFGSVTGQNWHDFQPLENYDSHEAFLSIDYTVSAVPIPAAVWLFGSGLLGLVGLSRRNKVTV